VSVSGSRVVTRHIYINRFVSCHLFMERVVFGSGGSTHLINCVVSRRVIIELDPNPTRQPELPPLLKMTNNSKYLNNDI
jgi:hypothetical protein